MSKLETPPDLTPEQQAKQRELADLLFEFLELRKPEKPTDEHYSDVLKGVCHRAAGRLIAHFVMTERTGA